MREKLDEVLQSFKPDKSKIIPMLQAVQDEFGYLPEEGMGAIARYAGVSESKVYGVATFYAQFYFTRRGENQVKVCCGTACHVIGAVRLLDAIERELGVKCGESTSNFKFSLERVACVGSCALAPVVMINDDVYGRMESKKVKGVLEKYDAEV